MGTGRRHGWLLAGTIVVLAVGAGAAPAFGAATLSGSLSSIAYSDAADTNSLTVTQSGSNLVFADSGAAITSSGTCVAANCPDSNVPALGIALGTGNDTVVIDSSVNGHLSSISVQGGTGGDLLINNSNVPATLEYGASAGPMTVDLASGASTGAAGDGADTFAGFDNISGSSFADTLAGDFGANVINGNGGADTIAGSGGDDTLNGSSGNDTVTYNALGGTSYAGAATGVTVDLGAGTARGEGDDTLSSFETVNGSALDDTLIPGGGGNTLQGGPGNDTLVSGPGDDTFDGGGGQDTLDFSANGVGVVVGLNTGFAGGAGNDGIVLNSVERVRGSAFNDSLVGDQNANVLDGQGGNDSLIGGGGDDVLLGGSGRDTVDYTSSLGSISVSLAAGAAAGDGVDTLDQIENVRGSSFGDSLTGDSANNVIQGGNGDDTIAGRAGDDTLDGGAGLNDTVTFAGASGPVFVDLAGGVATGEGADTLTGFENATGSNYDDTIIGDGGANTLTGNFGDDTFLARDGVIDTLVCGPGTDTATVDPGDVRSGCETVDDGTPPPPPPPPPTTTVTVTAPAPPAATVTAPAATTTVTVATPAPQLPVVRITGHPASTVKTKKTTARVTFKFSSSANSASFKCSRDFGAFSRCTSPTSYSAKVGKHAFAVEAVAAGLTGPPVTARFTVKKTR